MKDNVFYFSGTVGDSYIALCKLYKYSLANPCQLQRLCTIDGVDKLVEQVCFLFPNITYLKPFIKFDRISKMRDFAEAHTNEYVNIFYDGNGRGNEPNDPAYLTFTSFPDLGLKLSEKPENEFHIGIQLNSGSREQNSKILDPNWVYGICNLLQFENVIIKVYGTNVQYNKDEVRILKLLPSNVINLVEKTTVDQWVKSVASLDFFITPEGFPCFWALSQKVPCLVFYNEVEAVLRMTNDWRNIAMCVRFESTQEKRQSRIYPITPSLAASMILSKYLPDLA